MKNKMRRMVCVALAVVMAATVFSFTSANLTVDAADYSYSGNVAYVSDNGSDAADGKTPSTPKLTYGAAKAVAGDGGTVVITDKLTLNSSTKPGKVTIAGLNDKSVLAMSQWCISLSGDTTFKNIKLMPLKDYSFILAQGFKLVIDENVVVEKGEGVKTNLGIRGGGDQNNVKSTHVVIRSGNFGGVYAGTRAGNVEASCYVEVHDDVTIDSLGTGNDGGSDINFGKYIGGCSVVKLVGNPSITNLNFSDIVRGPVCIDVSEFKGKVSDRWTAASKGKVVKNPSELPDMNEVYPDPDAPVEPQTPTIPEDGNPVNLTGEKKVIYLSDYGDDGKDGLTIANAVQSLDVALKLAGGTGTIAIVDKYTHARNVKIGNVKIMGIMDTSEFVIQYWAIMLSGNTTFENITITNARSHSFFLAQGKELVFGEGITTKRAPGTSTDICIRGGGESGDINSGTHIVMKSGTFSSVHAATKQGSVKGNLYVEVHEGATISSLNIGNDGGTSEHKTGGTAYIKLVGAPSIKALSASEIGAPAGGYLFDLTGFTGELPESWAVLKKENVTLCTLADSLPEEYKEFLEVNTGIYDLSGEKNLVYISDSGDDNNDGKTPQTPFKTIKKAYEVLGEQGGTIAVTGMFTHTTSDSPKGPVKLTSTCKEDVFVWNVWALFAKGIEIDNLSIVMDKNHAFMLHGGKPVKIGKNVTVTLGKATVYPSMRAGEGGNINSSTDISIAGGTWNSIYTGTKKGNVIGNANVVVSGGTVSLITIGNDSTEGKLLGNVTVVLKGTAEVGRINTKDQTDGIVVLDVSEFPVQNYSLSGDAPINVVKDKTSKDFVYTSSSAVFINGYTDGTFKPNKTMTRAEAITVVSKISGINEAYVPTDASAFSDVKNTDWYYKNVKWLEEKNMIGFFGNELHANQGITRGEFVKLISNTYKAVEGTASFCDVPAGHAYASEITKAANAGLVTGYTDGTFKPDKTLTRAEIVTILNRLIKRNPVDVNIAKLSVFSDIDTHWAKNSIVAAATEKQKDDMVMWYTGEKINELTAEQLASLDTKLTTSITTGIDANNADAVRSAIEAKTEKRIAEIKATKTAVKVTGTSYYVSADGDDSNDGKTPETAWKTTAKVSSAPLSDGDGVFFRRGDTFRGKVTTQKGVTYSAYGEGDKPKIYGSLKNYSNIGFWQKTEQENVWVSALTFDSDVGLIVFDEGKQWSIKMIDKLGGYTTRNLKSDLEFEHDVTDKKLYLYSVSDPNTRWTSTEIAPGSNLFSGVGTNVTIDNLCLKYTGAHCIGYGDGTEGLTVQNCEMGWIGGKIQYWDATRVAVRFGNAVECYVSCKDYTIENCYIYQVYDAGITHQYFQTRDSYVEMKNIRYIDNVITHCTYAIEYCNAQPADKGIMEDIIVSGNILTHSGDGWGNQRPDRGDSVIKGWSLVNNGKEFYFYDNVVMAEDDKTMLMHMGVKEYSYLPVVTRNLFFGKEGNKFGYYSINTPKLITYNQSVKEHLGLDGNTFVIAK